MEQLKFFNRLKEKGNICFFAISVVKLHPFVDWVVSQCAITQKPFKSKWGEHSAISGTNSWVGKAVGRVEGQVDGEAKYNRLDKPCHRFGRKLN